MLYNGFSRTNLPVLWQIHSRHGMACELCPIDQAKSGAAAAAETLLRISVACEQGPSDVPQQVLSWKDTVLVLSSMNCWLFCLYCRLFLLNNLFIGTFLENDMAETLELKMTVSIPMLDWNQHISVGFVLILFAISQVTWRHGPQEWPSVFAESAAFGSSAKLRPGQLQTIGSRCIGFTIGGCTCICGDLFFAWKEFCRTLSCVQCECADLGLTDLSAQLGVFETGSLGGPNHQCTVVRGCHQFSPDPSGSRVVNGSAGSLHSWWETWMFL